MGTSIYVCKLTHDWRGQPGRKAGPILGVMYHIHVSKINVIKLVLNVLRAETCSKGLTR